MKTGSAMIPIRGADLHVIDEGDGPPVIIPSGAGSEFYRQTFSPRLRRALRMIYVDMRGTGGSSGSSEDCDFASLADDLEQVRAALGIDRTIALGHSNHGAIALEFARRHPQHAAAVINVGSVPDFGRSFSVGA